ncbi:retinol dehydrogenase 16-like [Pseudophryne corroboree]|uniref:retinol dehydrogenase 16-like n=1 Tax=Pseudophryne corroboree TaxID=495146 RepID=UPI0030820EBE
MWFPVLVVLVLILLYRWYRQSQILESLSDKYVFITGCDSGFGNLLARNLDRRGMRVLAACLTDRGAEELRKDTSSRVQTVILDVTDSQNVSSSAEWVNDIVRDKGLWAIVNNAGIAIPTARNEWLTKEDFFKILNVNLLGLIDVTLKMLPLIRRARGRVVNISSYTGRLSTCGGGYSISKYGVESFSDSLRREMAAFGVKVCVVEPGNFDTGIMSSELLVEMIENLWEKVPEGIRTSYGQQHFETYCRRIVVAHSKRSSKLHLVTDCIEHALTAVYPQTRYSAGWDAKLLFIPLSYLPTVLVDNLLAKAVLLLDGDQSKQKNCAP